MAQARSGIPAGPSPISAVPATWPWIADKPGRFSPRGGSDGIDLREGQEADDDEGARGDPPAAEKERLWQGGATAEAEGALGAQAQNLRMLSGSAATG